MCVSALLELHEAPSVECFATTITSPSGKYMANFDVKESKWRVTTVKPKKQIAKKKLREDAVKDLEQLEIMLLKERVMYDLNSVTKARSRPRKSPTI